MHRAFDAADHRAHGRITRPFSPDLERERRRPACAINKMLACEPCQRINEIGVIRDAGKILQDHGTVAFCQSRDQGILRREIPIDVAGAHSRFSGNILHRRLVETRPRKADPRRIQDAVTTVFMQRFIRLSHAPVFNE